MANVVARILGARAGFFNPDDLDAVFEAAGTDLDAICQVAQSRADDLVAEGNQLVEQGESDRAEAWSTYQEAAQAADAKVEDGEAKQALAYRTLRALTRLLPGTQVEQYSSQEQQQRAA